MISTRYEMKQHMYCVDQKKKRRNGDSLIMQIVFGITVNGRLLKRVENVDANEEWGIIFCCGRQRTALLNLD